MNSTLMRKIRQMFELGSANPYVFQKLIQVKSSYMIFFYSISHMIPEIFHVLKD